MNSNKRNVALLAACQALPFTNNSTLIAINGLAGIGIVWLARHSRARKAAAA